MSNLLNSLNAKLNVKTGEPKPERTTMEIPPEAMHAFERFAGAKTIFDVVEARKEVEGGVLQSILLGSWVKTLFERGTRPDNPRLIKQKPDGRPDITGLFEVQERFKFNVKKGVDDISKRIVTTLIDVDVPKAMAQKIVDEEIDVTPETTLKPFNELMMGHYDKKIFVPATDAEKAVAEKLLKFVLENLSQEERDLVLEKKEQRKVKAGFFERIKGYVKNLDQLKAVFGVIVPTCFVAQIKFAVSDTPEDKVERLKDAVTELISGH